VKSFGSKRGFPVFLSLCITLFPALAGAQQISLTPSTLSFGDVSVGSSKTQSVVVTNITKRSQRQWQGVHDQRDLLSRRPSRWTEYVLQRDVYPTFRRD